MNQNLFGWSDQLWLRLDHFGILFGDIMLLISFVGLVYGICQRNTLRNWLSRNRFPGIGGCPDFDWQGLVFTVSRANVPLWVIEHVSPKAIGLLTTSASQDEGDIIRDDAEQRGIEVITRMIENPDDPAEVKQKARELLRQMQENNINPIAVDITGGKTPMSVGAFMAAEEMGVDSIYVTTQMENKNINMQTAKIIAISQAGPQQ